MKTCSSCNGLGMKLLSNGNIVSCIDCNRFENNHEMFSYIIEIVTKVESIMDIQPDDDNSTITTMGNILNTFAEAWNMARDDYDSVSSDIIDEITYTDNEDERYLKDYPKHIINTLIILNKLVMKQRIKEKAD